MRLSVLVLLAMAMPIAGASDGIMRIAYEESYLRGAPALAVLSPGLVFFALFAIGASILAGAGKARSAAAIAIFALSLVIVANTAAVHAAGLGDRAIVAAALATSFASAVAFCAVGLVIYRSFGAFLSPLSAARAFAAGACGWAMAHAFPHTTALGAFGACVVGFIGYLAALMLFRELGFKDWALLRSVLSTRSKR
jgi:O-antigen/teichoic acid export membrane protein